MRPVDLGNNLSKDLVSPVWFFFASNYIKNKNQRVQAMAWKKMLTYFELIKATKSYLEPFEAIILSFGAICSHLEPFGTISILVELFGAIGSHLKPF